MSTEQTEQTDVSTTVTANLVSVAEPESTQNQPTTEDTSQSHPTTEEASPTADDSSQPQPTTEEVSPTADKTPPNFSLIDITTLFTNPQYWQGLAFGTCIDFPVPADSSITRLFALPVSYPGRTMFHLFARPTRSVDQLTLFSYGGCDYSDFHFLDHHFAFDGAPAKYLETVSRQYNLKYYRVTGDTCPDDMYPGYNREATLAVYH
jgi:hypothetical protein